MCIALSIIVKTINKIKMKKTGLISILILICTFLLNAQEPEQVYSIAKVYKPHEWYLKQAELWWKEIQKNKKNENAWYNYFIANRMASFEFNNNGDTSKKSYEETKFLMNTDTIVSEAQRYIPNTFTSNFIIWRNRGTTPEDFSHLEKAYSINPNFFGINEEMVSYYESQNNLIKRKEYNTKWYKLNELSSGLIAYNYNVLMTIKPNGAIITFGDNDSFPIWLLQDALDVRQDVTVLNTSLLLIPEYRDNLFKKLNISVLTDGAKSYTTEDILKYLIKNKPKDLALYIGLPAWKQMNEYENKLFLEGLALEYSNDNIDNIALLKNNFENKYALDYLKIRFNYDISKEEVDRININYLPAIFKLYEHYTISGDKTQANKMKELGLIIAQKGGKDWYDKALEILK
jgi:hypothetical protein